MSERRDQILATAAGLFAQRGFHGVSIADLGAACGISGPALYKHFPGKEQILAEMLVGISEELLTEGRRRVAGAERPLDALVAWHVSFALEHPELIVVQDRDWSSLPDEAREQVRRLQRAYVEVWATELRAVRPQLDAREAKAVVHATFGLLNSTPHSALVGRDRMHDVLWRMGRAALLA
ncbi:TetR/AcrR family transcriptional regulator [Nocardioides mangrovicus]|uniref:TetR/AcrR family transcriptional regulator n=1 Tax=Nocardioides mangrovicus TaxID=2478913 RepID=A0A3L8P0H5_9ACTN|nr:TetR/AcrR family transcriptional regulator [Nocardioides mangrovicus]RLV48417.1 TetR/AcrR family transcriptional regulator [Nocardioides mangrovicus]